VTLLSLSTHFIVSSPFFSILLGFSYHKLQHFTFLLPPSSFCYYFFPQYISMYADMGQKSNTMIFSDRPGDINALFAQAASVLSATQTKKEKVI
jgi:C-terminal region of band_7